MRKGEFDLTGKAVDCRDLPAMGDAGKEIFRALKAACNPVFGDSIYPELDHDRFIYMIAGEVWVGCHNRVSAYSFEIIQPSDVLGQAAIDAAMDGATIVFEGDKIPYGVKCAYTTDNISCSMTIDPIVFKGGTLVGYKLLEKKPVIKKYAATLDEEIESRILAEKVGAPSFDQFDEMRASHLELIRENMILKKENEAMAQRIKDIHRAINDAKVSLDV